MDNYRFMTEVGERMLLIDKCIKRRKNVLIAYFMAFALLLGGCAFSQPGTGAQETSKSFEVDSETNESLQSDNAIEASVEGKPEESAATMEIGTVESTLNGTGYTIDLADNDTATAFANLLPFESEMSELNGNEKYVYLGGSLPSNPVNPGTIEAGDVMLYGNNCLVVFYEPHPTMYFYTRIGKIADAHELASAFGSGSITASFTIG